MIKTTGIDFADLESEASDVPFGLGSGGGVIFGVTGGVTEAVIRRLTEGHDKRRLSALQSAASVRPVMMILFVNSRFLIMEWM